MPDNQPKPPIGPPSEPKALIVEGRLVPDADSVRSMLYSLIQRMKDDPALAQQFQADPRRVLGDIGLNSDIQIEAMTSMGVGIPEGVFCWWTCVITGVQK